ncbi:hypothetical protein S83_034723 [Arachis hypogaea]
MSTFKPTPDSNTYVPAPASADHAAGTAPAHLAATVRSSRIDPISLGFRLSEEDAQGIDTIPNPTPMAVVRGGASSLRSLIDLFVKRPKTAIVRNKKEKLRQQNIKKACNKEAVRRVHRYIAQ